MINQKTKLRIRRKARVRAKVFGTTKRPRLAVSRSLKHISAQIINDEVGQTLVWAGDLELKEKKMPKTDISKEVGKLLAKKAKAAKISKICFDRGSFPYHGRIKALAEGAREGGLEF